MEQAEEQVASEFGAEGDDPFASLGDDDGNEGQDPFILDEEEQDITAFGRRSNVDRTNANEGENQGFSVSRGLTSLFSSGPRGQKEQKDGFDDSLDDSSSSGSGSDEPEHPPLEARRSIERKPLDIDEDEEMGEMVAPTEENSNSSDEEVLSPLEKERLGSAFGQPSPDESNSEFDGQGDEDKEDDEEALVEIAMPAPKRRSIGR